MAMTNDIKNSMLDSGFGTGASSGTYISLHSGDPTTTVATALANEMSGAPYGRVQLNLAAASGGAKALAASAVISIQAGDAFSHYALWSVSSSGTQAQFKGSGALSAAEGAYGANGTYTISALSISL
jgi:hypothetical protein